MSFPFTPDDFCIRVDARLFGPLCDVVVRLIIDTGATTSAIAPEYLSAVGYDLSVTASTNLATASQMERVPIVTVARIESLGVACDRIEVVAQPFPADLEVDGVLGLNFFRGRILTIDFRQHTLTLA